ncbi:MAG: SDR family oxidoreductase [Actinomycetia bacterium]|nr:SDR family oxidoreductase [Actinomycetes bacterium]MCP5028868.1 SDR family oxidoreductase [Actinomycetes bacterium]
MDLGLKGKTALVTGSYRGTGAAIAHVLAEEGAIALVHGNEVGQPDEVVDSITSAGGDARPIVGDLLTDSGVDAMFDSNADALAAIDVLVNNLGRPEGSRWSSMDRWAQAWNTNIMSGVRLTQRALVPMRQRKWGRVVFLGTVGSRMPGRRNPAYYTAKSGLHGLVRSLAQELSGSGITANVVSPGMIATAEVKDMVRRQAERAGFDHLDDWPALQGWAVESTMANLTGRIAEPVDIARAVAFVCSEAAWHVNGSDVAVDGGAVDAR